MRIDYFPLAALPTLLAQAHVFAIIAFGEIPASFQCDDPRFIHIALELDGYQTHSEMPEISSNHESGYLEVWQVDSSESVKSGRNGTIAWTHSEQWEFGVMVISEPENASLSNAIYQATENAYQQLSAHLNQSEFPHLLRIWNYIDGITEGEGDLERYRQFCLARVAGMGDVNIQQLPAATAIGLYDGKRQLSIFWLAAKHSGQAIENPRQVSAYHYPRQYGPQSPTFARALLAQEYSALPLFISGTASVVGHATMHIGQLENQFDEVLNNIAAVLQQAQLHGSNHLLELNQYSFLKVYVRNKQDMPTVDNLLKRKLPNHIPYLLLNGCVCRNDLLVEIEAFCFINK